MSGGSVLGSLEIQLLADLARLRQDMDGAKNIVGSGMREIERMAGTAKAALGALGVTLGVAAFTGWIKGAIDAGDEAFNLSKKTGLAAQDVAGLQLAFKQAGVESAGMQTSLVKLSKGVAEGNEVFERLGVKVRGADGELKNSKQVLYDVADVFATMPEGINKTALATEVFGKSGADLLPMLSEGSAGLRDMADMAEKLGLVMDEETVAAADGFNDTMELVGLASDGVARKVAAELLPTLKSLAGTMLDNVTSSDSVAKASAILSSGLKILFSTVLYGAEIFNSLGKTAGAVAAVVVSVAKGEFAQAREIWRAADADIQASNRQTQKTVDDLWSGAGAKAVEQAGALKKALGGSTVATKEQADAAKKLADEQAKLAKAGQDYLRHLDAQLAAGRKQAELGRELTDGEKELLKLEEQLAAGKLKLTEAELESTRAKWREIDAIKEQRRQQDDYAKTLGAVAQLSSKLNDEQARVTETMRGTNVQLLEENEKMRLGEAAYEQRRINTMLVQAADLEWQAAMQGGNFRLEEQARLLRDRAALSQDGTALREAKAVADEWKKTTDSINAGLTDALFRAFESGASLWDAFRTNLVNTAKALVLKPIIQFVVSPIGNAMGALMGGLGMSGSAAAGTGGAAGGGGLFGSLASSGGLAGLFTNFGGSVFNMTSSLAQTMGSDWLMSNAGNVADFAEMGGNGLGYLSAFNSLTKGNYGAAAGSALGTYFGGPLGAFLGGKLGGLADNVFAGGAGTPHTGSVVGINGSGASTMWGDPSQILNNYNAGTDSALRGAGGTSVGLLNALASAFGGAANFGGTFKFAADGRDASIGGVNLSRGGRTLNDFGVYSGDFRHYAADGQEGFKGYLQDLASSTRQALDAVALPQWAKDTFSKLGDSATLEDIGKAVAEVTAMQSALLDLQGSIAPLGGVFGRVAGLSSDALMQLTQFAGGIDAFTKKVSGYVKNFFSDEEQAALTAAQVQKTLAAAGIDAGMLGSKADYRSLVNGVDVGSETGRRQLAALLDAADAFASISGLLAESGATLASLAGAAPGDATLSSLLTDQANAGAGPSSTDLLQTANDNLTSIAQHGANTVTQLQALVAVQSEGNQAIVARLGAMEQALADMGRPGYLGDLAWSGAP